MVKIITNLLPTQLLTLLATNRDTTKCHVLCMLIGPGASITIGGEISEPNRVVIMNFLATQNAGNCPLVGLVEL